MIINFTQDNEILQQKDGTRKTNDIKSITNEREITIFLLRSLEDIEEEIIN